MIRYALCSLLALAFVLCAQRSAAAEHTDAPLQTRGQVLSAALVCNYFGLAIRCPEPFLNTVDDPSAVQTYQNSPCGLHNPIVIRPVRKFLFPFACLQTPYDGEDSLGHAEGELNYRLGELIAKRQEADGSWFSDLATSNWCMQAFLSSGSSTKIGAHRKNVRKARDWLADRVQRSPERLTLYELTLTIQSFSELLAQVEREPRAEKVIRDCLQNLYTRQRADGGWAERQELRWEGNRLVWRDNPNRRIFLTSLAYLAIHYAQVAGVVDPGNPYAARALSFLKDAIPPCGAPANDPQGLLMEGLILSVLSYSGPRSQNYSPRFLASAATFGNRLDPTLSGNPPDGLLILYYTRMGFSLAFGRRFLWPEMKYNGLSYLHRTFFQNNQLISPDTGADFPYTD